jgi:hypothetical protein
MTLSEFGLLALETAVLFIASTVVFDVLHLLLHRWTKSRFALLRLFGGWHDAHHQFLDQQVRIQDTHARANLIYHMVPEYLVAMAALIPAFLVADARAVLATMAIHTVMFGFRLAGKGLDVNHRTVEQIQNPHLPLVVQPDYHFLHHAFPDQFFGSIVTLVDLVAGTACQIAGRRFLVTGASGAFGGALVAKLRAKGAIVRTAKFGTDWTYDDYSKLFAEFPQTDVLVLAHGLKTGDTDAANCDSFRILAEGFIAARRGGLVPPEVWATGSEIEFHGRMGIAAWTGYDRSKKAFARAAKRYYLDRGVIYRHIVPSAFSSAMGPGLISAGTAASWAVFFITRGFRYVPVSYTGLAYLNYLRFRLLKPAPPLTQAPASASP